LPNGTASCFNFSGNASGLSKASLGCGRAQSDVCYKKQDVDATFADDSFLMDEASFAKAEARRAIFVAEHEKLVKARADAAHIYFSAKDTAAEKVTLEGEWNTKWLASVTKHENALAHEDNMTDAKEKALAAKIAATAAHLKATEATSTALAVKQEALARWNDAKVAAALAKKQNDAANQAEKDAHAEAVRTADVLADADAEVEASQAAHKAASDDHETAQATEKEAMGAEESAMTAHAASVSAESAAIDAERKASRARSAALQSYRNA